MRVRFTRPATIALAAALLSLLGARGSVSAQSTAEPFVIVVQVDDPALLQAVGSLTAYSVAGEAMCGTVDLAAGETRLEIGGEGSSEFCRIEDDTIVLVDGNERNLFERFTFASGTTATLTNLAPEPPTSGSADAPAPAPAGMRAVAPAADPVPPLILAAIACVLVGLARRATRTR